MMHANDDKKEYVNKKCVKNVFPPSAGRFNGSRHGKGDGYKEKGVRIGEPMILSEPWFFIGQELDKIGTIQIRIKIRGRYKNDHQDAQCDVVQKNIKGAFFSDKL